MCLPGCSCSLLKCFLFLIKFISIYIYWIYNDKFYINLILVYTDQTFHLKTLSSMAYETPVSPLFCSEPFEYFLISTSKNHCFLLAFGVLPVDSLYSQSRDIHFNYPFYTAMALTMVYSQVTSKIYMFFSLSFTFEFHSKLIVIQCFHYGPNIELRALRI